MYKSKIAFMVLGALAAGSLAANPAVDTAKVASDVKADVHLLIKEFNARDVEKAVAHDAPDYVGMFHGSANVHGPAEDLKLTREQTSDPAAHVAVSNETVDVAKSGDMAVYRATYAYTFTDPASKKPTTEHGNWLLGYKAQPDGSLKLAWSVVSDTGPAAAK